MGRMPPSFTQRQVTLAGSMLPGGAAGRTSLVSPEPRPLAPLSSAPEQPRPYMVFGGGKSDTAVVLAESADYLLREDGPLGVWPVLLKTAGSTTTTVHVNVNGTSVGSVDLTSGETDDEIDLTAVWGVAGDRVSTETTAAGTGALGLSVMAPIA